jgi:hypothetical protein
VTRTPGPHFGSAPPENMEGKSEIAEEEDNRGKKRRIGEANTDEISTGKLDQHDCLVKAAFTFKNARINRLSLEGQNNLTDAGNTDATGYPLPTVSSLDDAYRIQVSILSSITTWYTS